MTDYDDLPQLLRERPLKGPWWQYEYFLKTEDGLVPIDAEPVWKNDEIVGYVVRSEGNDA